MSPGMGGCRVWAPRCCHDYRWPKDLLQFGSRGPFFAAARLQHGKGGKVARSEVERD